MKKADFESAVRNVPQVMARFELLGDLDGHYATDHVHKKGDKFLYHPNGCMIPEGDSNKSSIYPSASKFKFLGYYFVRVEFGNNYYAEKKCKETEKTS